MVLLTRSRFTVPSPDRITGSVGKLIRPKLPEKVNGAVIRIAEALRNSGGITKVTLLNINVSGLVALGTKDIPLNITVPPRSELNQPRFALVHPVTLPVVQGVNPKLPLKVLTVAEKSS